MKKIITVAGARPNFVKIAPLCREMLKHKDRVLHLICHTGQHFDDNMSQSFFRQLELPKPDFSLGIGSGSHSEQTARIMIEFEKVLLKEMPDLVVVVGDVNSTLACSLVASKLNIRVAHIESGLRSFDRTMPEEINRLVTDSIADILFVSEESGLTNLRKEGVEESKMHFVGNIMIDSLVYNMPAIHKSEILKLYNLTPNNYILVTFHRPSNVDDSNSLKDLLDMLNRLSETKTVVFPVHPRTNAHIREFGLHDLISKNIILSDPAPYFDFLALTKNAELVITDSGGIQEETTFMGVPCITFRNNTERPVTVLTGTNQLAGTDLNKTEEMAVSILKGNIKKGSIPELWDGKTAERIVGILLNDLGA